MKLSRAELPTQDAVGILRWLCVHWGREFAVEFDDGYGKITLPKAYVTLMSSARMLSVYVETAVAADQDSMEDLVAEQVQRFGDGEDLCCRWLRD